MPEKTCAQPSARSNVKHVGLASNDPTRTGDLLEIQQWSKVAPASSQHNTDVPDCVEMAADPASGVERGLKVLESWDTGGRAASERGGVETVVR